MARGTLPVGAAVVTTLIWTGIAARQWHRHNASAAASRPGAVFEPMRAALDAEGESVDEVGFITDIADADLRITEHRRAQFAMAPRLVHGRNGVKWMIGVFRDPANAESASRSAGFRERRRFPGGIYLFAREAGR